MRAFLSLAIVLVFFCLSPLNVCASADSVIAVSKISSTMIYQHSARVTREAKVQLKAGEQSIVLENILSELDENSLTVAGRGQAKVRIYGAHLKREYLKQTADARVEELQKKVQGVEDQIVMLNNELKILDRKDKYISSINLYAGSELPKELVTHMPTSEYLAGVYGFVSTSSAEIESRREEIRLKARDLGKEKDSLQRELNDLRNTPDQKLKRSIVVDVACDQPGEFILEASYLVGGASWRPVYDARTQYARQEIALTLFSVVSNRTGEDWENVTLTLSTVDPTLGGRMPYVDPLWLNGDLPAPRKMERFKSASDDIGVQYEAYRVDKAVATLAAPAQGMASNEAVQEVAQVAQKGISVVYTIARPVSIKSDGVEARFPVISQNLKADFKYSAYPRAVTNAYLGSRVTNEKTLQLLAGEVNLFLEGDYIGKSMIDAIGPGQEFDLYLGVDENIKVKREQLSRKTDDVSVMGLPAANTEIKLERRLTVENNKAQRSSVILFESMPVSQNDRIKVKNITASVEPKEKDWKERKGVWRWEFDLEPNEKKEIVYSLSVEYPRGMRIGDF